MGKNLSIATISLLLVLASTNAQQVFDIKSYGAQPNADITQALTKAWKAACAVARSKVVISVGAYKLGLVTLLGPCKGAIEFNLQGTLQAPSDVASFNGKDDWVVFESIDSLTVSGGGVFDGKGQQAWQKNKCNKDKNCNVLPVNIRFNYVTNSIVQDITSKDSKFFHINLFECKKLQFQHVTITAPADSPNTDGIHMGSSSQITITDANIGTGDDCISIGDGNQDVTINQVTCGPGHGISIGSLGKYQNEQPVSGIRVTGATLNNTDNGVRIKTWPSSPSGVASDIHFENVVMNNVANPIVIDQNYCPNNQCSNQSPSKVKISNVSFKKIRGTSSTKEAVNLICSKSVPCQQVVLSEIDLAYKGGGGSATSTCTNVQPAISGKQNPPACTKKF
ncbi:exopolygalacturonase-like [Quercus lobata]|uniref:exopolygalacturonase-like n=1 Tax=Quercus lobata TaxID=97700 RepID=UPI00124910CE|nr:exopolygalacturonase-like [Quercus lobata]